MRKSAPVFLSVLFIALLLAGGCGGSKEPAAVAPQAGKKVVAFAMLRQETNVFSPVPTTIDDFEAAGLLYGEDVLDGLTDELVGFVDAVEEVGRGAVEAVPIYQALAMSGGKIEAAVYERFKRELLQGLREMEQLDGLYLSLHGSMGVEGLQDPESDLLQAVRDEFGNSLPIGISYDLHANVTEANARLATFIVGYLTNPHRDHYRTGYTSGEILCRTVLGEIEPVMAFRKMRLLKGGGMNIDFLPPMRHIFNWIKKNLKREEVLSISNYMVHLWLDEPELGWSTVVVTDGNKELAEELAEELADMNWAVRDYPHKEGYTPSEAIKLARSNWLARKLGTVMFCDASDAVGAGGPGENTWILKALIEEGSDLVSYIPLRDREAALEAYAYPIGETITLTVGGKLERTYNRPLEVTGEIVSKKDWLYGKTVILKHGGVHLIITEMPPAAMAPDFYTELGLNLWKADIVVAKNLFPFRFTYLLYNRKTIDVITPGTTNVDIYSLDYTNIPDPIYPFNDLVDWR